MPKARINQQHAIFRLQMHAEEGKRLIVYAAHFEKDKKFGISKPTIKKLFGSFEAFAEAAGLIPGISSSVKQKEKSREEVLRMARTFVRKNDIVTPDEYVLKVKIPILRPVSLFKRNIAFSDLITPA